jgi:hypothetical protein
MDESTDLGGLHKPRLFSDPSCPNNQQRDGLVVLFPYANVSNEKLVEFLREKLSFSTAQARTVTKRVFVNFEPLCINTTGRKFFSLPTT